MKMWKCKWGCVSFHHTPASPVDKPENAACWKVMSDQKSDAITSIKVLRAQNFGRLRRGDKPRINQELWTTEPSGEQMFCLVFRVCEDEPHAEEEEADFRRGRCADLWCPKAEPWPLWNVLKVLRHIWRFVSNPFEFEVCNLKIYIHIRIILI